MNTKHLHERFNDNNRYFSSNFQQLNTVRVNDRLLGPSLSWVRGFICLRFAYVWWTDRRIVEWIFKFFTSVFGFKLVNTFLSGKFLILLAGEDQSTD